MPHASPQSTYLKDYTPPAFEIHHVDLVFTLSENSTQVKSTLQISRKDAQDTSDLILQGKELRLLSLKLNQKMLENNKDYKLNPDSEELVIKNIHQNINLEIITEINPALNTSLEGLYKVNGLFCTQCESQGFRKITYYLDRPDVMTKFTTTIIADKNKYPVLLSNGNLIHTQLLENNQHLVTWEDPFKKPCYLFALVAGDLSCIQDEFITQSHRKIMIKLYVDKGDENKTAFALASIKKAMKWDEENYGREYDLDIFMVVATHDFNMGAMENKGLNIFNSKYILANPQTATEDDYTAIERVIGHEYFHNWTGNRITCRDWFQLSLKESLTVFRDAQFSADMTCAAVVRINDVNTLRSVQFPEDAGPLAHPVQPKSYIEINNFYTVTIYEKGAEVIRMLYTLLGKEKFRQGMDVYFERHDGQAVRIEEFIQAHSDANQTDFSQFMQWYHEAGTPELKISSQYFPENKTLNLTIKQIHPSGKPFYLPFKMGLLDAETGKELCSENLLINQLEQDFVFHQLSQKPIISLLRDFSAPVKIDYYYTHEELAFLLSHDSDPVSRWDAGQALSVRLIASGMQDSVEQNPENNLLSLLINSWQKILTDDSLDPAFSALLLLLPNEHYLIEQINCPQASMLDKLFAARKSFRLQIAENLKDLFLAAYHQAGVKALKNRCLSYLSLLNTPETHQLVWDQFNTAQNMTDEIAALSCISNDFLSDSKRQEALDKFYQKFSTEPLVIDKWFALQAKSELPDVLDQVKKLLGHPAFSLKNPNKVRALIGAFCQNLPAFHAINGSGYVFLTEQIIALNLINPIMSARLCEPLTRFKKYDSVRKNLMKSCLEEIKNTPNLSDNVYEIINKSLLA